MHSQNIIYLDNASGGLPSPHLVEWYGEVLDLGSRNPHGGTSYAEQSRRLALEAEHRLLHLLGISETNAFVIWTSGVTEALNLAATANISRPAYYSPGVHAALLEPMKIHGAKALAMSNKGKVLLPNDAKDIGLLALSQVNNETGVEQDLIGLRRGLKELSENPALLVDAAQSFGKVRIPWDDAGIDYLALSSRKLGGPASVGALVVRRNAPKLSPIILGGGQQHGMRSGTMDVCGIEMFVRTAQEMCSKMRENQGIIYDLDVCFQRCFLPFAERWHAFQIGDGKQIKMLALPGFEGAVVSRIMAQHHNVIISSASACSAETGKGSNTVLAMGYSEEVSRSAIRISFSSLNTAAEINRCFEALETTLSNY